MAASLEALNAFVLTDDGFHHSHPEDRVSRKGVPDHRAQIREPRSGAENWKIYKEKLFELGKLKALVGQFDYQRLPLSRDIPQIRLLRILPADTHEAKLECDLVVMNLDEVVNKYEALSYCWGKGDPEKAISISSLTWDVTRQPADYKRWKSEQFPVRSNLHQALKHLRGTEKVILLWVDAICINQRSTPAATAEKNNQLSMMSRIYNAAKNVCIWLGDSDAASKEAFLLLNSITNFNNFHKRLHNNDVDHARKSWRSLVVTLKTTPWFSRRWIIQEIASARSASVHCGLDVVHWDDLAAAISLLDENCAFMDRQFGHTTFSEIPTLSAVQLVKALTNVCRKTPAGEISERLLDFETLVCTFQQFQATFSQDVIHAVRALAYDAPPEGGLELENGNGFGLGVDAETSTRDLFVAFVKRCIRTSGSLDIICRHWAPTVRDTVEKRIPLPSWISELSNAPFGAPGESHERQNGENFVAISPSYKWKRYNVSDSWKATTPYSQRPLRVAQINGTEKQQRWSSPPLPIANYSPKDIVETPTIEKNGFFENVNPDGCQSPDRTISRVLHQNANEPLDISSTSNGIPQNLPATGLDTKGSQPELISERPPTPLPYQTSPKNLSPTRHKRSNTMPAIGRQSSRQQTLLTVPEYESKPDHWKFIFNNAISPNKIRDALREDSFEGGSHSGSAGRQSSKAIQESYEQGDKEHHAKFNGQLEVEGIVLGTIAECSDMMRDGIVDGDWLGKLGWQDGPHNSVPDQLWRLLVADRTANGSDPPEWYSRACLHCLKDSRLINSKGDFNSHKELPAENPIDPMTSIYLKRVESVIWRRRIARLKMETPFGSESFFALAPEKTREGDLMCILAGCSVPVVLKRRATWEAPPPPDSEGVFELVGEAYVHTIMNGEAVRALKKSGKFETGKRRFVLQ